MEFVNKRKNKKSIEIPKLLVVFSKVLQRISPKLVTRFGAKLFMTPVKFSPPKRERLLYKSAQQKKIFIPSIAKEIEVLSYGYSKRKVLFVHGWAGRSTQLFMTADKLLENGFMMVAFDGPAHGNSSGKKTSLPEFIATIKTIDEEFGPFEIVIGHSFGGLCLLNAINEGVKAKGLITIGTPNKISEVITNFTKSLGLKDTIATKIKARYDAHWQKDIDTHSSCAVAKHISIPTLVIHDSFDGDVSVSSALAIRQNLQKGELYITKELGHTKILRDKKVTLKIMDFIKSIT